MTKTRWLIRNSFKCMYLSERTLAVEPSSALQYLLDIEEVMFIGLA